MNLENLRKELNPEQFRAVSTTDGALLIIAGAGSGKTRVITFRIAHMLDCGIPQSAILALTFTNKAAREMEDRVKELTGKKLQNLTVSTFHAFGVRILRQDIEKLGWRSNFSIYDDTDRNQLIKESGRELGFSADNLDVYKIGNLFSNIKIGRWTWEKANDQYRPLYEKYQEGALCARNVRSYGEYVPYGLGREKRRKYQLFARRKGSRTVSQLEKSIARNSYGV